MNTQNDSFIDRFFFRLSYSFKLKLVLFFGFFPALLLWGLTYPFYSKPHAELDRELLGLHYQQALAKTVENMLAYIGALPVAGTIRHADNKPAEIAEEMQRLILVQKDLETTAAGLAFQTANPLNSHLNFLQTLWDIIKQEKKATPQQISDILFTYAKLVSNISIQSGLLLALDTSTQAFTYCLLEATATVPELASQLYVLSNTTDEGPQFAAWKQQLKYNNQILSDNLNESMDDNPTFLEEPAHSATIQALRDYLETSEAVLQISLPAASFSHIELQKQWLKASLNLGHALSIQLQHVLQAQINTLKQYKTICLSLIAFGAFFVVFQYMTRIIQRPLENLKRAAEEFSRGNFSMRAPIMHKDEVGLMAAAFNDMGQYFEKVLTDAAHITIRLERSSSDIIASSQQLENNMGAQENTVHNISINGRAFLRSVQEFAEDIQKVHQNASITTALASTGRMNLQEMENIMQLMLQASSNIVSTLNTLQEKVGNINQVILTIVEIADQSNLLFLNTAIRANRSGGQGKGFVVIANRIREMANQIAYTTLDIEKVIKEFVEAVKGTSQEVEKFSAHIRKHVEETADINEGLNKLMGETQAQIKYVEDVNESMKNQTHNVEQINNTIEELRRSTQSTTHSVKKLHAEMSYLYDSSHTLREMTERITAKGLT